MSRLNRTLPFLLSALMVAPACAQSRGPVERITLQRTACFGTCPIYKVTLLRDGSAIYEGGQWAKRTGRFRASIDSASFAGLADLILGQGFAALDTSYQAAMTDMPTTYVCLRWAPGSKCIEHYGPFGPPNLDRIEDAIDSVAERLVWVEAPGTGTSVPSRP